MKTRLLFVPATMPSHMIPLMALARLLNGNLFECTFLLPQLYHGYARSLGFNVLDIDRKLSDRTTPEMTAIASCNPDVIVDDLSYTTAFSSRLTQIPRISIVRKGILPL